MGPADYLTLASTFPIVIITSIPILRLSNKNQARRFISLIDALYEARCRLICLAETSPEKLFFHEDTEQTSHSVIGTDIDVLLAEAVGETRDVYRPNVSSYDAPNMAEAPSSASADLGSSDALETLSMFSGKDEQFAYKRALSRLLEMTSESYGREEKWTPLPDAARKWEQASALGGQPAAKDSGNALKDWKVIHDEASGDFAAEAAYEGTTEPGDERPEAPRLREEHVWGVREDWGDHAGAWGRGTTLHEQQGSLKSTVGRPER